jgi:hypothetical protein
MREFIAGPPIAGVGNGCMPQPIPSTQWSEELSETNGEVDRLDHDPELREALARLLSILTDRVFSALMAAWAETQHEHD